MPGTGGSDISPCPERRRGKRRTMACLSTVALVSRFTPLLIGDAWWQKSARMSKLVDIVAASRDVAATRSRKQKTQRLAALLAELSPPEVRPGVGFLCGELRQGKLGLGYATLRRLRSAPGAQLASVSVLELDALFDQLAGLSGKGSAQRRETL